MASAMDNWYEAIKNRVSIRKYSGDPDKNEFVKLKQAASFLSTDEVRIVVGRKEGIFNPIIGRTISGTDTYAAIIAKYGDNEYMVGSVGEAFVLECTSLGFGTCWLGLSYNKATAAACIKHDPEVETIRCLISIGHYDESPEQKRARKKKRTRKTIYNLTGIEDEAFKKLPDWQRTAIECARLAPSARNAQPWEFDIMSDSIQVACVSRNFGYGAVDCGIAMLHIEVGAAHCGVYGDWDISDRLPLFKADYDIEV